jgi:hypothetical protein
VHYHYVKLNSSAASIQQGLDLWRATVSMYRTDSDSCDDAPWRNARDLYDTIDSITVGRVGWTTHWLSYDGPLPSGMVPHWMKCKYELNVWDVLSIFEEQLASKEFDGQFDYTPYEEYDKKGSRVYSDFMSGSWVLREAVSIPVSCVSSLMDGPRTRFLKTRQCMDRCIFQSLLVATRLQYWLQLEVKNTIPCMCHSETSRILPGMAMGMV